MDDPVHDIGRLRMGIREAEVEVEVISRGRDRGVQFIPPVLVVFLQEEAGSWVEYDMMAEMYVAGIDVIIPQNVIMVGIIGQSGVGVALGIDAVVVTTMHIDDVADPWKGALGMVVGWTEVVAQGLIGAQDIIGLFPEMGFRKDLAQGGVLQVFSLTIFVIISNMGF